MLQTRLTRTSLQLQRFRKLVKEELAELNLCLMRFEAAETLEKRLTKFKVHKRILKLASNLTPENQIAFDVFATFDKK